jgi:hypothetical protein
MILTIDGQKTTLQSGDHLLYVQEREKQRLLIRRNGTVIHVDGKPYLRLGWLDADHDVSFAAIWFCDSLAGAAGLTLAPLEDDEIVEGALLGRRLV